MPSTSPRDRCRAFSILELLVVLAIIALLLAIMLPALSRSRDEVASITCRSNLHSLAVGWRAVEAQNPNFGASSDLSIRSALERNMADSSAFFCPREPAVPAVLDSYAWPYGGPFTIPLGSEVLRRSTALLAWERHAGFHSPGTINMVFDDGHVVTTTSEVWLRSLGIADD